MMREMIATILKVTATCKRCISIPQYNYFATTYFSVIIP
jgi:hypothetical protein